MASRSPTPSSSDDGSAARITRRAAPPPRRWTRVLLLSVAALFAAWTAYLLYEACGPTLEDASIEELAIGARAESAGGYGDGAPDYQVSAAGHTLIVQDGDGRSYIQRHAHRAAIRAVALSNRGRYLASAGGGGDLRVWSVAYLGRSTSKPVLLYELPSGVRAIDALVFSTDENVLAVLGDEDRTLQLWQLDVQEMVDSVALQPAEDAGSFRLQLHVSGEGRLLGSALTETVLEYLPAPADAGEAIGELLVDDVSGEAVRFLAGPERRRFNPAKASSWSPTGRYWGYAEGEQITLWKLCARSVCSRVELGGRSLLE